MNYYERHIGDYLKDTAHLSLLHHGIYSRLMDVYYTRELGFNEGEAHRLIGARSKEERAATDDVLQEFFSLQGGVWYQRRCDQEIARYRDKQEKAKRSADVRWAQSGRNANASHSGDANGMRTHSEGNALQSPVSSPNSPPPPNGDAQEGVKSKSPASTGYLDTYKRMTPEEKAAADIARQAALAKFKTVEKAA